jgi:predicted nucleic acid-binding OB-fold protein
LYVGKDSREEVTYIIGRIGYEELTAAARAELPSVIVNRSEPREMFVTSSTLTAP